MPASTRTKRVRPAWTALLFAALFLLPSAALAQRGAMMVVIKFNEGIEAWQYARQMAVATGMSLVGVSTSTNTAVYTVPNETDRARGTVASRNGKTIMDGFPGTVMSYNFGVNYPAPRDLAAEPPEPARGRPDRRGRFGRFSDRDRLTFREWYSERRDFWEARLREGEYLDATVQALSYPAPPDLARSLGPVPVAGGRYLVIGDNLVLVDRRMLVLDVIRFRGFDDRRGPPR